jgi:hypothetical protein
MNEDTKNENSFMGYEYKDIIVNSSMEPVYSDAYVNFGYKLEGTSAQIGKYGTIKMKFKRDRKIRNKAELTRLQRQFDACVAEIETLERSKVTDASVVAYAAGIIGTGFMAGSVFSYQAGMVPLCIVLAIPAFIGWVLPYFCYNKIHKKKVEKVAPLVDEKYDEIYEVCAKANSLLG